MESRRWLVMPAAGRGERFGADVPKQYALLGGRMVIERALACFEGMPGLAGVVIALAAEDTQVRIRYTPGVPVHFVTGGTTRSESVMAALVWLHEGPAEDTDWVLVHDAARPLLSPDDRDRLVAACEQDGSGGLLAIQVVDTLKQAGSDGRSERTVSREGLWRAQTPQMFRLGALKVALDRAGSAVTDEAAAMEAMGFRPVLVPGSARNLKITTAADLQLAESLLSLGG